MAQKEQDSGENGRLNVADATAALAATKANFSRIILVGQVECSRVEVKSKK